MAEGVRVGTAFVEVVPKVDKGFKERVKSSLPNESDGGKSGRGLARGMKAGLQAGAVALGNIMSNVATDAAGKLAETFTQAFQGFADYEQLTGGVEKLFGEEAAATVKTNAEKAFQSAGMSANQYMEQVTSFSSSLIKSLDGDTKTAANYADEAMRDMSDNANTFGTDMASIQNAYQGFAKGNFTMLDNLKLGYGGTKEEMEALLREAEELEGFEPGSLSIDNFADIVQAIHAVQEARNVAGTTANEAASTVSGSIGMMQAAWENWLTALGRGDADMGEVTDKLVQSIQTAASNAIPVAIQIVESLGQTLVAYAPVLYDNALVAMSQIAAAAPDVTPQVVAALVALVSQAAFALVNGAPALLTGALQMAQGIVMGLLQSIPQVLATLVSMIPQLVMGIASGAGQMLGGAMLFFDGISQALVQVGAKLGEMVVYIVTHLPEIFMQGVDLMFQAGQGFLDGLVQGFTGGQPQLDGMAAQSAKQMADSAAAGADGSAVAEQFNTSLAASFDMSQFQTTATAETKAAIDAAALTANATPITKQMADTASQSIDRNAMDEGATSMVENAVKAAQNVDSATIGREFSAKAASGIDTSAMSKAVASANTAAAAMSQSATIKVQADLGGVKQLQAAAGTVKSAYASMGSAVAAGMRTAAAGATSAAASIKRSLSGLPKSQTVKVNVAKGSVQLPHFSMSGDFNPKTRSVPTVSVSWWAKGGIFTEPTIFANGVGEAGPEAVLPLSRLTEMLDESNGKYAGNTTNIYVDGIQAAPDSALYRLLGELVEEAEITRRRRS